jgi:hypothetical protein
MYQVYTNIETGKREYRHIQDEPVKVEKLSKNQKRKAKRYSEKTKTKVLGITAYQYACVETHRAHFGANPELKLILAGY